MKKTAGLFAVDVDGTLITDHGHITETVYSALEKAVLHRWEVVVASGRTFYAARRIIEELPFIRYAALSNGAVIMDMRENKVLYMESIQPEDTEVVVEVIREKGAIPALYNTNLLDQRIYYDSLEGACSFFEWYVTEDPRCVLVDDVMDYTGDVLQIGTIAEKRMIFDIRDALDDNRLKVIVLPFENARFGGKNTDYWFLQVVEVNVTKHKALKSLAECLNIPPGRLVAAGDNYNDADMIRNADIGVAMGNSPEEIKKLANVVVGSNNDSGLAEVVDEVLLSGKYFPEPD
ncbi:Cof-type HAD-IIB family hydrolase [Candidatus Latescibacterota bacterium]